MRIDRLSLANFRNYRQLEFDVPAGISVFHGANAQGKTNLLESILFLATTRLSRSVPDRELVNWEASRDEMAFGRLATDVVRDDRTVQLEIVLTPRMIAQHMGPSDAPVQKTIRVNGVSRRAVDLLGQLNVVMFSPRDVDLVSGEPALRRRYLDIMNSQVDQQYLRALQRYNKVLARRNQLLRQVAARQSRDDEFHFWDEELVKSGAYILFRRWHSLAALDELTGPIHGQLSSGQEGLSLVYQPRIGEQSADLESVEDAERCFTAGLSAVREDELSRGVTLVGPHRDELRFLVDGIDMGSFGSRGQLRTIALSLKLAEARYMLAQTGETPVLLLDDVLSELDVARRRHLVETAQEYQQVLMTTTDLDRFPSDSLDRFEQFQVIGGAVV